MKFAFFGFPHTGGTYTVFHALRRGLASHGVTVKWLGLGLKAQAAYDSPVWANERENGMVIAGHTDDESLQAEALIRYLDSSDLYGLFVNVLGGRVETNAIRYLGPALKRVMIVHNITPGTYAAASAVRNYVHATICVSPRIRRDLIGYYGFKDLFTHEIPNAIDLTAFSSPRVPRPLGAPLRVLFLGRIVDTDKGVFWLPKIMAQLPRDSAHLTVVGDGPDMASLRLRFTSLGNSVTFTGNIAPNEVPSMLAHHDVFIFPSRFEGLGLSLVEAMAGGCVPVATRIKGVTDFVVTDGRDGILFGVGDTRSATNAIHRLALEPKTLHQMSDAARQNVAGRFALEKMAISYRTVIEGIRLHPKDLPDPIPFYRWAYPSGLKRGFRSKLPSGIKNFLRLWRERLA
jgi:glycosyltransferase involved in cell wall biosynthesis